MFIYHFSRLIKSKLLWGFLALLMVFAFVVMDSCTGPSAAGSAAGYLGEEAVSARTLSDASQTLTILNGNGAYYLPGSARIFGELLRDGAEANDLAARRRQTWKIAAARQTALDCGLAGGRAAAEGYLESAFTGPDGFSPAYYRAFLSANGYTQPNLFQSTFSEVWFPAQTATLAVFNAAGWVSPMEREFALSALYDTTVAYTATLSNTLKPEALDVTDAEIEAWHAAHGDSYRLPDQRTVTYVEVPIQSFGEGLTVEEIDAMQYYEDHSGEFRGTGTNATVTLPFEEVKDKAIAKVRDLRAMEEALRHANETLIPAIQTQGLAEAAKAYGEPKTATLRQDRPFGFQKARDVIAAVFEMDIETTPLNAVAGTDKVYLLRLDAVTPSHVEPLDQVKERVRSDVRRDELAKRLKTNGETIRSLLADELAKGSAFDAAVAACHTDALVASTAMTFVLSEASGLDIPHRAQVLEAASTLGAKTLSEPILSGGEELLLVYIAERTAADPLVKITNRPRIVQSLGAPLAARTAAAWLNWNLDRTPPSRKPGGELPILTDELPEE